MGMGEKAGWGGLNNSVVFTWGFVEMLVWFWVSLKYSHFISRTGPLTIGAQIFTTLREERQVTAAHIRERQDAQNNML